LKPLCIDLYCGLGGWAEGFLAEGYRVKGFDIEAHDYGSGGYPGELILADVLKLHGSQFKDAAVIVASPPCTEPSYMAMPWKRAKAELPEVLPDWWNKPESKMSRGELNEWIEWRLAHPKTPKDFPALFEACFRSPTLARLLLRRSREFLMPWRTTSLELSSRSKPESFHRVERLECPEMHTCNLFLDIHRFM
jgi:hypothetical protein